MLKTLQNRALQIYKEYRSGLLLEKEYIDLISALDEVIDKIELQTLNCYLQGNFALEKSSLKHLH